MIDQSVGDVTSRPVETVADDASASAVARLFADRDIGSVLVVGTDTDEMVGIVTESDVMHQVASGADVTSVSVRSFMSTPVVTAGSQESIHAAATRMREHSIRRLPVVDGGDPVGVLTTSDLTHYMPRLQNAILRGRDDLARQ